MKRLLLTACVLLSSCQLPRTPLPAPDITAIEGRVTLRAGEHPDEVSFMPVAPLPQGRVPIAADGTFTLPLPVPDTLPYDTYVDPTCDGNLTEDTPEARYAELSPMQLRLWKAGANLRWVSTQIVDADGTRREKVYIYASHASRVTGTQVCEGYQETFDLQLRQGWNLAEYRVAPGQAVHYQTLPRMTVPWF